MRNFIQMVTETAAPLKLECTARSYAVEIPVEAFQAMTELEDVYHGGEFQGSRPADNLDVRLMQMGCSKVEYNGHYGSFIYFTIDTEDDTPEFHGEIIKVIAEHLAACAGTN